jgi:hypothetical protein
MEMHTGVCRIIKGNMEVHTGVFEDIQILNIVKKNMEMHLNCIDTYPNFKNCQKGRGIPHQQPALNIKISKFEYLININDT